MLRLAEHLPAVVRAIIAVDAWNELSVLQHAPWLGRLFAAGRRTSSKLPELVDLVMARPLISAGMVAKTLSVTPQAAQRIVLELGLRDRRGGGGFGPGGLSKFDGFLYRSRLTGANCVAIFDRAIASKLMGDNVVELVATRDLTAALLELSIDDVIR